MVRQAFGPDVVLAQEQAEADDADNAAGRGTGLDLIVADVALVIAKGPRIGMREDHRAAGIFHRLHAGAMAAVGDVHEHAEAVHLVDHGTAEIGQADVLVVAAAAGEIVAVVGEQHLPDAEPVIELHHLDPTVECVHALDVESHGHFAVRLGPFDLDDGPDQDEIVRVREDPVPEGGEGFDRAFPWQKIEADIDRQIVDTSVAP